MPYAVLDDGFHGHPKILRGGPIVELLQLRAIAHCNRYLTDGLIDQAVLPTLLHGLERLEIDGTPAKDIDWVAELLKLGLWERHDRGYVVHDYLQFNRSREQVEWLKGERRRAGAKGGQASAQARAPAPAQASAQAVATPNAQASASNEASAQPSAQANAQALHGTTSTSTTETTSRPVSSTVNGSTTPDAPSEAEVRAMIRRTAERLGSRSRQAVTTEPASPPDDDTPPF